MSDAERYVDQACYWIKKNPAKWERMRGLMLTEYNKMIDRINDPLNPCEPYTLGRDYFFALAQLRGIDISLRREYRKDHNNWSVLARIAIAQMPELDGFIVTKKCAIDDVDISERFLEICGYELEMVA